MPISEDEARQLIDDIESCVQDIATQPGMQGISDLVVQWRSDVAAGRSVEQKFSVQLDSELDALPDAPRSRPTRRGDFVGEVDYTNAEQLDMLVDVLCLAFLAPSLMSRRVLDTIEKCSGKQSQDENPDPVVHLVDDAPAESSSTSLLISRKSVAQSFDATRRLATLLDQIVREKHLTPRRFFDDKDVA